MHARARQPVTIVVVPFLRLDMLGEIEVQHDEALAGRNTDQRIRPLPPPLRDDNRIGASILEPVQRVGLFIVGIAGEIPAREYRNALRRKRQREIEPDNVLRAFRGGARSLLRRPASR